MSRENQKKFDTGKYDFLGNAKYIVPIWFVIMFVGIFVVFYRGLNYGIDFAGGTEIQVQYKNPIDVNEIRQVLKKAGYDQFVVQSFGDSNEVLVRVPAFHGRNDKETTDMQNEMLAKVTGALKGDMQNTAEIRKVDSVGPQVGEELKRNSVLAVFYSLFMILIYIGMRFDYKYAPGAVICVFHDAILIISIYAIFGEEVSVQTLAAILTFIGYSLNDTIITFDRIRENEKVFRGQSFYEIVNRSINDMLSRTILTHVTTELAVSALYFLSDGVIKEIAFTLMIGILIATFSSIYIASPLVILLDRFEVRRAQSRMRAAKA